MVWSPAAGRLPRTVPPGPQNGSRHEGSEADTSREPGHLHCWAAPILAASCHGEDHAHLHDRQGICRPRAQATPYTQQMSPSGVRGWPVGHGVKRGGPSLHDETLEVRAPVC